MTPERHDHGHVRRRRHVVPIPNKDEHPWLYRRAVVRWRLAVMVATYPVTIAIIVAFAVASVPLWLVLDQAHRTNYVTRVIQAQRVGVSTVLCHKMQENTVAVNRANLYIQGLIVSGAKGSKAFDDLLRSRGLPPYKVRVQMAEAQAAKLGSYTVPPLNCTRLLREITDLSHITR